MSHSTYRRRVLLCIPTLMPGGAERAIVNLALSLDRELFDVQVCAMSVGGPLAELLRTAGIPVHILGGRLRRPVKLLRLLWRFRPYIVHVYLPHAAFWIALPAWLLRIPKRIYSIRTSPDMSDPHGYNTLFEHILILPFINGVTFVSEHARDSFMQHLRYPIPHMRVIRNGVDLNLFRPDDYDHDFQILGAVGRLSPEKGHAILLRAFQIVMQQEKDLQLWIIGDGPVRHELEALAESLGVKHNVRFWGIVTNIPDLLSKIHIYVSASLFEGIPNAHLEAMAAGKPIVSSRVDGVVEIVDDESAILVTPNSPEALAAGIRQMLDNSEQARKMGRAARQRVERDFSLAKVAREHQQFYLNEMD